MKTSPILISIIMILALSTPSAFAQRQMQASPPDERQREEGIFAPDARQADPPSEERREEIRKKIEAIRIWRLTEELKLDTNTSARLSALLSSVDQKRREIQRDQMEAMRTLRQTLRSPKPDEAKLRPLLDRLESNHRAMQELRDREIKSVKELLSPEQQARFLIFQQEFQREMRGMIAGARRGPGMGGGQMRGGQGPPDY